MEKKGPGKDKGKEKFEITSFYGTDLASFYVHFLSPNSWQLYGGLFCSSSWSSKFDTWKLLKKP